MPAARPSPLPRPARCHAQPVASIFAKLRLPASEADNRRVLAVLRYLRP